MRNEWGGQGFSMVELLVTMVIGALAIAFMSSAYIAQKRVAEGESSLREVNVRAQLVMNRIKQYIRNAGLGAESNLTKGASVLEGANRSYGDVFTAEARSDGPDALTVVTGFPVRARVDCPGGTCTNTLSMDVDHPENFDTGTGRYVYIGPSVRNGFLEVTALEAYTLTLSEPVTVFDNDPVFRPTAYTITLDMDTDGNPLDVDADGLTSDGDGDRSPDLYIYNNLEDLDHEEDSKVTEAIEDLQFQYLVDSDGNGLIEDGEWTWVDDPTASPADIRAVRVWLLVRSTRPDPAYVDNHVDPVQGTPKSYRVADHLVQLDSNDDNGLDSHLDHHFHRALLVESVMVRNRNL